MFVHLKHKENEYTADLNQPLEIGIEVHRNNGARSFGIANASYATYKDGDFIGSRSAGAGCNLETITFTPHGNSTHTECVGHISTEIYYVNDCIQDRFYTSLLHTFTTKAFGEDLIVDFNAFDYDNLSHYDCLIIRTMPNDANKLHTDYSGKNAPYIHINDMQKLVDSGIQHIILDLPSVDKEWDNGALAAHHIFWNYPQKPRLNASISEFAFIPSSISDGSYLLKLNIANFKSDAAPSRPTLYSLKQV